MEMIDFYVKDIKKQAPKGYLKTEIGFKVLNTESRNYYNVFIEIFRSVIVFKFKNKGYLYNDQSVVDVLPSQRLFLKHRQTQFTVDLLNVQTIILKVDCFHLISKDSNSTLTFYSNDPKFKNQIVDQIIANASTFLNKEIRLVTLEDSNHLVVSF